MEHEPDQSDSMKRQRRNYDRKPDSGARQTVKLQCPMITMATHYGEHDCNSLADHINLLERQVNSLQYEFESELRQTLIELVNLKSELKASHEEQDSLRRDLGEKCQLLKMTSSELNSTKYEIARLKVETEDVKLSCSHRHSLNITEIVGAINSTVYFKAEFKEESKDINNGEKIIFNKIMTNEGGGYDVKNGTFIAPKSGTYMVWVDIYIPGMCSFINVLAQKEGQIIGRSHIDNTQGEVTGENSNPINEEEEVVKGNIINHGEGDITEESYIVLEQREVTDQGHSEMQIEISQFVLQGETTEEDIVVHHKEEVKRQGHTEQEKGEVIRDNGKEVTEPDFSHHESGETIDMKKCYPCREEAILKKEHTGLFESNVLRKATLSFVTHFNKGEKLWLTKESGCSSIYSHDIWPRSVFGCILLRPETSNPPCRHSV